MLSLRFLYLKIKYFSGIRFIFRGSNYLDCKFQSKRKLMNLNNVVKCLEDLIPPGLAESWDNTGLLLEPFNSKLISTIFLTNDLTECVLEEALSIKVDMIISYHPLIFTALKSLKKNRWKDRIVIRCIENSIALYCPHTACDAVKDGVNDWLIGCFDLSSCAPIQQSVTPELKYTQQIDFCVPNDCDVAQLKSIPGSEFMQISSSDGFRFLRLMGNKAALLQVMELISNDSKYTSVSMTSCDSLPFPSYGMGRIGYLKNVMVLEDVIKTLKEYLHLDHLRVAFGSKHNLRSVISTIAVCAGSGSSVLRDINVDLYITGEMSHHDLLDANHRGVTVVLCEHSNTERGYLQVLASQLIPKLPDVNLVVSKRDTDPILII